MFRPLLPSLLFFALWVSASGCGSTAATHPTANTVDRRGGESGHDKQTQPTLSEAERREAERRATEDYHRRVMENARRRHYRVIWINPPYRVPVESTK